MSTLTAAAPPSSAENPTSKARYVLALGHLCSDINQGSLAALLPFLIAAHHYSYTTAATLVMVSNLAGSIIQPVFGHMSDKENRPGFMLLGVSLAAGGMALTGYVTNFAGLCLAVMVSGIGVALFHPQAAKLVNATSRTGKKGVSMGIFSFGGNLGFTLGPILTTLAMSLWGLKGTLLYLLGPLLFGTALHLFFPKEAADARTGTAAARGQDQAPQQDDVKSFAKLSVLVTLRSIVYSGVSTFLVLYFIHVLGQTDTFSSTLLSIYYAVTAASSLLGGKLADLWGEKKTIVFSCTLLALGLMLFPRVHSVLAAGLLLVPMGMGISLCYSSLVLSGQRYLPNHMGLASGVTLGLAVSIGGIVAPLLGKIADTRGLTDTYSIIGLLAVVIWVLALWQTPLKKA